MCFLFKGRSNLGCSFPINKEVKVYREISPEVGLRKWKAQHPLSDNVIQMQVKEVGKKKKLWLSDQSFLLHVLSDLSLTYCSKIEPHIVGWPQSKVKMLSLILHVYKEGEVTWPPTGPSAMKFYQYLQVRFSPKLQGTDTDRKGNIMPGPPSSPHYKYQWNESNTGKY